MSVNPAHLRRPSGLSVTELRRRKVAILIFEGVGILDVAAPFEVFATADELGGGGHFHTFSVAESPSSLRTQHGVKLVPDFTLEHAPRPDVLVLPGGRGTRTLLGRPGLLEWIGTRSSTAGFTLGLSDGIHLLTRTNLLSPTDLLERSTASDLPSAPERSHAGSRTRTASHPRGTGLVIAAAGVGAALDASLHVVRLVLGDKPAETTARNLDWERFAQPL